MFELWPKQEKMDRANALLAFFDFVGDIPLLGHNVEYDYRILQNNLKRDCGLDALTEIIPVYFDSLKLARLVEPRLRTYKLESLLEALKLTGQNSHKADDDIEATLQVVTHCVNKARSRISKQAIFREKYQKEIEKIKTLYGPLYKHTLSKLYEKYPPEDMCAVNKEIRFLFYYLYDKGLFKPIDKLGDIMDFLNYDIIKRKEEPTLYEQLNNHVVEFSTFKEADLCDSDKMEDRFFISTVHKAKGLEFENVIVFNVVEGVYPFWVNMNDEAAKKEDARKLYVAMSRAKKRLCIMTCNKKAVKSKKNGQWYVFDQEPSPFLNYIRSCFEIIGKND